MKRFVFWGTTHNNWNIAFCENLQHYAQGETFWKAMKNLSDATPEFPSSSGEEETDITRRQKMFYETGVNKVEVFVEPDGNKFALKCANSRSLFDAKDEEEAPRKYIAQRADTSKVNSGEGSGN